jgi:hypothetical protein
MSGAGVGDSVHLDLTEKTTSHIVSRVLANLAKILRVGKSFLA